MNFSFVVSNSLLVFLHGAGDGPFDVMNSQSLPRLLGGPPGCFMDGVLRSITIFSFKSQVYLEPYQWRKAAKSVDFF